MKGIYIQLGSSIIVASLGFMSSFACAWPSYAVPMLKSDQSPIGYPITENEANIISSIPMLASIISTLFAGYILEALGRKKTQILCTLIYLASWSLIATARSVTQLIVARFIIGLDIGLGLLCLTVYIGEITELRNRGGGATIASVLTNTGIMTSYLEGWLLSYDVICYTCVTAAVVALILNTWLKDSPSWLIRSGREEEALTALKFYRGESETTKSIIEEFAYLKSQTHSPNQETADAEKLMLVKESTQKGKENHGEADIKNPLIELVTVDYNRRALITSVIFMVLSASTGSIAVQAYANQIFAEAVPTLSPDMCSVFLSIIVVLAACLIVVITDLVTRRTLMISASFTSTTCLALLGVSLHWSWVPAWVAPLGVIIYCLAYQVGVINVIFIQLSETFGPKVNSLATAIVLCFLFATNFIVVYSFGSAVLYFGMDGTFFIYTFLSALTTVLSIFFLKETRWVPIEDVQKVYSKGYLCVRL